MVSKQGEQLLHLAQLAFLLVGAHQSVGPCVRRCSGRLLPGVDADGQMLELDSMPARQNHGGGEPLLELANIEWPRIEQQRACSVAAERDFTGSVGQLAFEQRGDQDSQVFSAVAQRGKPNHKSRDAGQEVRSKQPARPPAPRGRDCWPPRSARRRSWAGSRQSAGFRRPATVEGAPTAPRPATRQSARDNVAPGDAIRAPVRKEFRIYNC